MITRDEFPYLQQLLIKDAYAAKNIIVPVFQLGQRSKHLLLTGKNGSGKTTVLQHLASIIHFDTDHYNPLSSSGSIQRSETIPSIVRMVEPSFFSANNVPYNGLRNFANQIILAYFEASRKVSVREVTTVTREDSLESQIAQSKMGKSPAELFKQYLVNKKVFQVFDIMEGRGEESKHQAAFFLKLEQTLAKIFEDPGTKLEFVRENFEFYINLSDGRRFTFNQLSAGFSAFLSILTDLLMRTDLLRKQANDYSYDPCGFVLIDEPETHLHLEMQYQILPLLTSLFPNLQFIVATHSPAVASSITGATVFDLSTGEVLGDQAAGSSYSELMQTHFGVENEYSNVADAILAEVDEIRAMPDRTQALARLQRLMEEKGQYMSPVLQLDIQAQILHLKREQAA
ncbi:AAA family ATPase [Hymenobacter aquaticus]|uniref:AAA family ATPase n=1 Tax=Hymenobacter aquaticus TaxID=1867101 RepID=A0A4Z0Q4Z3_9BACT|nr:AAA family ATPase [Hymenobacter aquaticus]TGE24664.1 AAA family ATPase [Hymenobacter aquaticus]